MAYGAKHGSNEPNSNKTWLSWNIRRLGPMESLTRANKTIKDNATSENTHQATPALVLQGPTLAERLLPFFGVLWTEASDENCYHDLTDSFEMFHSSTHAQSHIHTSTQNHYLRTITISNLNNQILSAPRQPTAIVLSKPLQWNHFLCISIPQLDSTKIHPGVLNAWAEKSFPVCVCARQFFVHSIRQTLTKLETQYGNGSCSKKPSISGTPSQYITITSCSPEMIWAKCSTQRPDPNCLVRQHLMNNRINPRLGERQRMARERGSSPTSTTNMTLNQIAAKHAAKCQNILWNGIAKVRNTIFQPPALSWKLCLGVYCLKSSSSMTPIGLHPRYHLRSILPLPSIKHVSVANDLLV